MAPDTARHERLTAWDARRRLEQERHARLDQLRALEAVGEAVDPHSVAAQADAIQRVLTEIDAAFERLENATYGACEDCAVPLPVERLEILPYARRCVTCRAREA